MTDLITTDPDTPHRTPLRFPEAHPNVHVSLSPEWRYTDVSPEAAEQLGRTVEQLLGRVIWDVFPGLEHTPMGTILKSCMAQRTGGLPPITVRLPTLVDGVERDTCATIAAERREPGGLYITFRWASVVTARRFG